MTGTPTLTIEQAKRLGLKVEQPAKRPGDLVAIFARGKLVNPLNADRGWSKIERFYRGRWKERVTDALYLSGYRRGTVDPCAPKVVAIHAVVRQRLDSVDGLRAACKAIVDALKLSGGAGLIDDDRDSAGHEFVFSQEARRRAGTVYGVFVTVRLRAAGPAAVPESPATRGEDSAR